jgi:hypothetical protein
MTSRMMNLNEIFYGKIDINFLRKIMYMKQMNFFSEKIKKLNGPQFLMKHPIKILVYFHE